MTSFCQLNTEACYAIRASSKFLKKLQNEKVCSQKHHWFAERRFKIEVFGSSKRLLKDGNVVLLPQVSKIWYSELAVHNASAENDEQWFAVNGSVYNVSSFYETHPGGKRIVSDVTGLDGTHVFHLVSHDVVSKMLFRTYSRYPLTYHSYIHYAPHPGGNGSNGLVRNWAAPYC